MRRALFAGVSFTLLAGCGPVLGRYTNPDGERTAERYGEKESYTLQGEVRDSRTMVLIPDAAVETWSDVHGYAPETRLDGRGGFQVNVLMVPVHNTPKEQLGNSLLVGDQYAGEELVSKVALRAHAGARCSRVVLGKPMELSRTRFVLWLDDCDAEARVGWPKE